MNANSVKEYKPKNIIEFSDVSFKYFKTGPTVLDIDSLSIKEGEKIAVIGPSGAGKTTFFRMINGYIQPDLGYIKIFNYKYERNSKLSREISRKIGFVFQEFHLVDRATVYQNVLWGRLGMVNPVLSILGIFSKKDKKAAMRAIEDVNLLEFAGKRADQLSGGQKQRVAIARALAQQPRIILADEPISNLDPALAEEILLLLSKLCQKYNTTLLMNLHQPALADSFADRVIGFRDGKVVFDNPPNFIDSKIMNSIFESKIFKPVKTEINVNSKASRRKVIW